MPKIRETCTECSNRRQKCDKGTPCGRCVKRGVADRCKKDWGSVANKDSTPRYPSQTSAAPHPKASSAIHHRPNPSSSLQAIESNVSPHIYSAEVVTIPDDRSDARRNSHLISQHVSGSMARRNSFKGLPDIFKIRMHFLQMLMPSIGQIWRLVNFHEKRLLWYHGCYHGPSFNDQLNFRIREQNIKDDDVLSLTPKDLQWYSLLFAIIAGGLVCARSQLASSWGFEREEVDLLSQQWHSACIECLELADYMSRPQIYAVQAILTLTMSSHSLGYSNKQYILMGAALKIAQLLGLHDLKDEEERITAASSSIEREVILKKEVGRRIWSQLCIQDWFSIPLTRMHNISRRQYRTIKPANRDYLTMEEVPENEPTYVSYGNYLFEIASLIADLNESLQRCNTEYSRYQQVMRIDTVMRQLAIKERPSYFDVTVAIDPTWPWYIGWARRSLTICFAHKIIVIHRTFLAQSFDNPMFSYTRRTCIAAAKTILKEAQQEQEEFEPVIWIDQAFCIAAGIVLALDVMHRQVDEPEVNIHSELIDGCVSMLSQRSSCPLASKGVRLLQSLLELAKSDRPSGPSVYHNRSHALNVLRLVNEIPQSDDGRLPPGTGMELLSDEPMQDASSHDNEDNSSLLEYGYGRFAEMFPPQTGFPNAFLFVELLGMELE